MKTLHSVIAIGLVGCLLAFPLVEARALQEAQPPAEPGISDWNNLQRLGIWDKVEVVRHNLSKHKGKLLAWTEESISLRLKNRDVTIPREEVYRVTQLSKGRRGRNALIGLALGAAVGAGIGAAIAADIGSDSGLALVITTPIGASVGAGVGAAFPSHPTLYRAPRSKREERFEAQRPPPPGKLAERSEVQQPDLTPREKREEHSDVQRPHSEWDNLQWLLVGDKIEVVGTNLSKHEGTVLAWTEGALSLRTGEEDVTLPREEVYRVTLLSENKRKRNALIGMAIGAAGGAAVGPKMFDRRKRRYIGRGGPQFLGSLIGVGIGAGTGAAFPSHRILYRAPNGKSEEGK